MEIVELILFVIIVVLIGCFIINLILHFEKITFTKRVRNGVLNAEERLYFVEKAILAVKEIPTISIATALESAVEEELKDTTIGTMYLTNVFGQLLTIVKGHPVYVEEYGNNPPKFSDCMWFPYGDKQSKLEVLIEYRKWLLQQIEIKDHFLDTNY